MLIFIYRLDVVKPGVHIRQYGLKIAVRCLSACIYVNVYSFAV